MSKDICELCGDSEEVCMELEECPGAYVRRYDYDDDGGCFFCNAKRGCICDDVVNAYKERNIDAL